MTYLDLVTRSLVLIGAVAPGETITNLEAQDGLNALMDLVDGWNIDPLTCFATRRDVYTPTPNQASYQIGPGAIDFTTPGRPNYPIQIATVLQAGSSVTETPLQIYTDLEWSQVRVKSVTSPIPQGLWCDYASPIANLFLWPVMSAGNQIALYTKQLLNSGVLITDTVTLPPGYAKAFRYNLAVDLAPEYGHEAPESVMAIAISSRDAFKSQNARPIVQRCDSAVLRNSQDGRNFNYLIGQ